MVDFRNLRHSRDSDVIEQTLMGSLIICILHLELRSKGPVDGHLC